MHHIDMNRRHRSACLISVLNRDKTDACLVHGESNLAYLTGHPIENGFLLVSTKGSWLVLPPMLAAGMDKWIDGIRVVPTRKWQEMIKGLIRKNKLKKVTFDPDISHPAGQTLEKMGCTPKTSPVKELRMVKNGLELADIRSACRLTVEGFGFLKGRLRIGVTEKQLADELICYFHRRHADKVAFDPIVAFGSHTAVPHHVPGPASLGKDQPVLFDIGCTVNGYRSDLTRTVFFGRMNHSFRRVYGVVQRAQRAGLERVRPGVTGGQVDASARSVIRKAGFGRFYIHNTGHGVGLDIHEGPWLRPTGRDRLASGMILTVEPGIYIPGRFGVRIEDTVLVTRTGFDILTK